MEYKKKINSEIKNNYKSNNLQNNKIEYSNKQNIITNDKNNNLKSHTFKMIGNYKKTLNKTLFCFCKKFPTPAFRSNMDRSSVVSPFLFAIIEYVA